MGKAVTIGTGIFLLIGGLLFGYNGGIVISTIGQPAFISYFGKLDPSTEGGVVSSFTGGGIVGASAISRLADSLERKGTIALGGTISTIGCALQAGAANIGMLIASRLIDGFAVGILSAFVPMYCSEIAEASYRGTLCELLQFMLSRGYFAAQWIGYGCNYTSSSFQWRFPLAFQVVPNLALAIGTWFLQESPRWLMEKDRHDEAREALYKLHGTGSNDEYLELEFCGDSRHNSCRKVCFSKVMVRTPCQEIIETPTNAWMWNSCLGTIIGNQRHQLLRSNHLQSFGHRHTYFTYDHRYLRFSIDCLLCTWIIFPGKAGMSQADGIFRNWLQLWIGSTGQCSPQSILRCRWKTIKQL